MTQILKHRSKYPLYQNVSLEKVSPNAQADRSSLYSENIPKSMEEALSSGGIEESNGG